MLDESTRNAVLRLKEEGHGSRAIARALNISRNAAKAVLRSGQRAVPRILRIEKAESFRDEILALYADCKGNLVRVHEEILARGASLSYQGLTAFCRRHGIGKEPKKPAGQYHFKLGEEMQHDTSPHRAKIGDVERPVQTASLVLCHSRMLYIQMYPRFTRFECKVFLTDAISHFGGAAGACMIDNTHVVVLTGTGRDMVPVPEMAAFGERFGFKFIAHEKGDANRSARVERPFDFIENNFLAGRKFDDFEHLNREAKTWCDKVNGAFNKRLHASHLKLFQEERPHLKPLPIFVPDVYLLHQRIVDLEGYVSIHRHRYSAPFQLIGRRVEVRETKDRVLIYEGPREIASHKKVWDIATEQRVTLPEHRPPMGERNALRKHPPEEEALLRLLPEHKDYVLELKKRRGALGLRALLRLANDYPKPPLSMAIITAAHYLLFDVARLERMVLKNIARDYFLLPPDVDSGDGGESDGSLS